MSDMKKVAEKVEDYRVNRDAYRYGVVVGTKRTRGRNGHWYDGPRMQYKRLGYSAKVFAEWFKSVRPDAEVTVQEWSENKPTPAFSGAPYNSSYGGEYSGYRVEVKVDGESFRFVSTETYRTTSELLDFMLNHI